MTSVSTTNERLSNYEIAAKLNAWIKSRHPSYWVRWNPDFKVWDDSPKGVFEIGTSKNVHYRRANPLEILRLSQRSADENTLQEVLKGAIAS